MPIQRAKPRLVDLDQTPLTSITSSNLPTGSCLQVVHRNYNPLISSTTQTFTDITNFNVTITPTSASNKVFLMLAVSWSNSGHCSLRITRKIGSASAAVLDNSVGDQELGSNRTAATLHGYRYTTNNLHYDQRHDSINILDTPNTTEAVIYQLQGANPHNSAYSFVINRQVGDQDQNYSARVRSSFSAMEIKG